MKDPFPQLGGRMLCSKIIPNFDNAFYHPIIGQHQQCDCNEDEKKLFRFLFFNDNKNKSIIPTKGKSLVNLTFDISYIQLIELVSFFQII